LGLVFITDSEYLFEGRVMMNPVITIMLILFVVMMLSWLLGVVSISKDWDTITGIVIPIFMISSAIFLIIGWSF